MTLTEEVVAQTPRRQSIPVLKTERLILRAPRLADLKAIAQIANDRRIAENAARIPSPYSTNDAEQFVTSVNSRDGEGCFVVICAGKPIGICSVDLREEAAELGYWLGAAYWGHGFATEAAHAVIDTRSTTSDIRPCWPVLGSAIRHRGACWRNAVSSGRVCVWCASAPSIPRLRPIVFDSIVDCGNR
jgi:hypothetical protein